jgi:hypothetical protein
MSEISKEALEDHREIWLECKCAENGYEGRQWCQDNVFENCEECGLKPVKYIRADLCPAIGEGSRVEGLEALAAARKKHIDAVSAYNARREILKAAGIGSGSLDAEYRAFSDAQSEFIKTAQAVADAALAAATTEADHG